MQKQAPTFGRLLVMVAFALSCFGLIIFLWLAFGGPTPLKPNGWRFKASFGEATQLAQEADVRISGVPVGKVKQISFSKTGRAIATIEMQSKYAPIPADSKAILRQKTLLGETFVELTPGSPAAPKLKEGATLPVGAVSPTVELDEIFRAFNAKTRDAFRTWMQSQSEAVKGRGQDISDTIGNLAPFAEETSKLLEILNQQKPQVQRLVRNTGEVFDDLTARDSQLRSLISNSNRVFETTAARNQDIKDLFVVLPTFESESTKTVNKLDTFAHLANPLIQKQLRPAARELSPTLQQFSKLAPDLKGLFQVLKPLIRVSRPGLPALRRFLNELKPVLKQLDPFLRNLNPVLSFLAQYKHEATAFFANTVAATEAYDIPAGTKHVHYLRTLNPNNPEDLAVYNHRIGSNRPNPYTFPLAFKNLKTHMKIYENRQCGAPIPTLSTVASPLLPDAVRQLVVDFTFGQASNPGPLPQLPCDLQPKYHTAGGTTQYPHVVAQRP